MFKDVGLFGAAGIAFMLWLFFKDNLGGILGSLTGNEFFGGSAWAILTTAVDFQ
ncbi:MAG: hypothetical protein KF791_02315 [Verrucomicrobiae bacterium]|nr:hypothetical protein [Verrucomicrobiae bacterium]